MTYYFKDVTVTIVEASGQLAGVLKARLEELEFRDIVVFDSAAAALADKRTFKRDLVFCDWQVADMDGLQFISAVRADPEGAFVNLTLVDAESDSKRLEAAAEAGANNYIAHPFDAVALMRKVEALLGRSRNQP